MKKRYIKPEMDIIEFDTKDVITTSGIGGAAADPNDSVINVNGTNNWSGWID